MLFRSHKIDGHVSPMRRRQLADADGNTPANGNLLKDGLVSEAEFEAFHGFLTILPPDMVISPGKTTKSVKVQVNSAGRAVNSAKELVKSHNNLIQLLGDLTKS